MGRRRRWKHSAQFEATVIGECKRTGVSVAAVALAHGLNANTLRKRVMDAEHGARHVARKPLQEAADRPPIPARRSSRWP